MKGEIKVNSVIGESTVTETVSVSGSIKDILTKKLEEFGISPDRYSITHWQSGKTQATNEFRDHDSVFLVGRFYVPQEYLEEYNRETKSQVTQQIAFAREVVQAIYRSRIRDGKLVDVYYSNDISDTIGLVKGYLCYQEIDSLYNCYLLNLKFRVDELDEPKLKMFNMLLEYYKDINCLTFLRKCYWVRNYLFSSGVFIVTVGNNLEIVRAYVKSQGS